MNLLSSSRQIGEQYSIGCSTYAIKYSLNKINEKQNPGKKDLNVTGWEFNLNIEIAIQHLES